MLVISRKQGQQIQIGDNITVTVLRTKGQTVRLGIEAPRVVGVRRGELAPEHTVCASEVSLEETNEALLNRHGSTAVAVGCSAALLVPDDYPDQGSPNCSDPSRSSLERWTMANMRRRISAGTR